ncbi:alpha/beta hydrolase [Nocardia farcinica]
MRDARRLIRDAGLATMIGMDPELEPFLPLFPPSDLSDIPQARRQLAELAAAVSADIAAHLDIEDRTVPGEPAVPVRIYRPQHARGAIVWAHGGGFVMGDLDTEHPWATRLADGSGATVISVGYRLAPEHPFPAAHDDMYAVLTWAAAHADELGIDPARIAVGGHSSGAGIAASVALRARDEQGPPICLLHCTISSEHAAHQQSLMVSPPTTLSPFLLQPRCQLPDPARPTRFVLVMAAGSIGGSVAGGLLLGVVPSAALIPPILTALLIVSAVKVWCHQ